MGSFADMELLETGPIHQPSPLRFTEREEQPSSLPLSDREGSTSSSSGLKKKKRETPRKVDFGGVRVHTHAFELGDNPSCQTGFPLTLGWEVIESEEFNLEDFDEERRQRRRSDTDDDSVHGRNPKAMAKIIPPGRRAYIAKINGFSHSSMIRVFREISIIKRNRAETKAELLSGRT